MLKRPTNAVKGQIVSLTPNQ